MGRTVKKDTVMASPRSGMSQNTGVIKGARAKQPLILCDDGALHDLDLPLRDSS